LPEPAPGKAGRPRKYGKRLGNAAELATAMRENVQTYTLHVYGAMREVVAAEQVVMLKTLRRPVRVVWVYRKTQWVALVTTDLDLSVEQIIEYYSARWKIEAGFREIKQEIGSAHTQTRNPDAVFNHLHFCMVATTTTWIYAEHLKRAPIRRYASKKEGGIGICFQPPKAEERSRDRNLLSAAEGGREVGCPETAPRARLRPAMPHESILNRPTLKPPRVGCAPSDGCVLDFLDFRPILARSRLTSRLGIRRWRAAARRSGGSGR